MQQPYEQLDALSPGSHLYKTMPLFHWCTSLAYVGYSAGSNLAALQQTADVAAIQGALAGVAVLILQRPRKPMHGHHHKAHAQVWKVHAQVWQQYMQAAGGRPLSGAAA